METVNLVKDCMSVQSPSFHCDLVLSKVIEKLVENHIVGAPVVDDNNQVIGFVSEHDCIAKLIQSSYYCEPESVVREVMSSAVITVQPDTSLIDVAQLMQSTQKQVFPVVAGEDGKTLVGIINRSMLLMALKDNQSACNVNPHA